MELSSFLGSWRDSLGHYVQVSEEVDYEQEIPVFVATFTKLKKKSRKPIKCRVREDAEGSFHCGWYQLDVLQSSFFRAVWINSKSNRCEVSIWTREDLLPNGEVAEMYACLHLRALRNEGFIHLPAQYHITWISHEDQLHLLGDAMSAVSVVGLAEESVSSHGEAGVLLQVATQSRCLLISSKLFTSSGLKTWLQGVLGGDLIKVSYHPHTLLVMRLPELHDPNVDITNFVCLQSLFLPQDNLVKSSFADVVKFVFGRSLPPESDSCSVAYSQQSRHRLALKAWVLLACYDYISRRHGNSKTDLVPLLPSELVPVTMELHPLPGAEDVGSDKKQSVLKAKQRHLEFLLGVDSGSSISFTEEQVGDFVKVRVSLPDSQHLSNKFALAKSSFGGRMRLLDDLISEVAGDSSKRKKRSKCHLQRYMKQGLLPSDVAIAMVE